MKQILTIQFVVTKNFLHCTYFSSPDKHLPLLFRIISRFVKSLHPPGWSRIWRHTATWFPADGACFVKVFFQSNKRSKFYRFLSLINFIKEGKIEGSNCIYLSSFTRGVDKITLIHLRLLLFFPTLFYPLFKKKKKNILTHGLTPFPKWRRVSKTRIFRRNNKCVPRGRIRRENTLFNGAEGEGEWIRSQLGKVDGISMNRPSYEGLVCVYIYIYKIQEEILDFRGSGFRGKSTSRKGIVFLCPYPSPSRVIDGYLSAGETLFFAPKNFPPRGWGNICISFLLKISWKFWSFNFFSLINLKGIITNMHDYKNFNDPQF